MLVLLSRRKGSVAPGVLSQLIQVHVHGGAADLFPLVRGHTIEFVGQPVEPIVRPRFMPQEALSLGDTVWVAGLQATGEITELAGDEAEVTSRSGRRWSTSTGS